CVDIADLTRNAVAVLPEGALEAKLKLGRPLRVKLGIDVTAPDVTLGNGVPLRRMRAFQDEGHKGVLIVGDYTTRIGDPSGRKTERPMIEPGGIDADAPRFFEAASTIIDPERTELRFNSEWLSKLDFAEILRLTRATTVARILERAALHKRFGCKGADLDLRAPLSDDAGLRLGRGRGGCRTGRNRPDVQPAHGPRGDVLVRARAPGRADRGVPRQLGRRGHERLAWELHRAQGGA